MFRLEFSDFQFNRDKAGKRTVIKQQVDEEICIADLNTVLLTDKGKVPTKFKYKLLQIFDDCFTEILFRKLLRQVQKLKHIGIENAFTHILRNRFRQRFLGREHITLIVSTVHLAFQFTLGIMLLCAQRHVEMPFFRKL